MNKEEFKDEMLNYLSKLKIDLSEKQINQFYDYMILLIEWNKVMNLTGIAEPREIIIKHFVDSLTVFKYLDNNSTIIDVGTGAGFPGIPIKILYPNTEIILLDSLNKRINFLNEVINKLNLNHIKTIHGRAEDFGTNIEYREKNDIAIARAVAPLNILLEYLMPFVKVKGKCICMKGLSAKEELENSKNALKELKGKLIENENFVIPDTDIKRNILVIEKTGILPNTYPRKAGTPRKKPL